MLRTVWGVVCCYAACRPPCRVSILTPESECCLCFADLVQRAGVSVRAVAVRLAGGLRVRGSVPTISLNHSPMLFDVTRHDTVQHHGHGPWKH